MVGKYTIHDTHAHGILTVAEVFKFSSNIGATKIARRLGRERLAEALDRFGFGHPTEVGLPGERTGVVRPVEKWGDIGFANVSFGQGITVTPLQVIAGVSAIAAGGVYHQPRIVSRVVSPDGAVEIPPVEEERRVMSEATARAMVGIMRGVTETGGTAAQAAIDGYPVAGKTGTAQKAIGGHYDPQKCVSSFVGFAPAQSPRIALMVVIDEPRGEPPRRRGRGAGVQGDCRAGAALPARAAGGTGGRQLGGGAQRAQGGAPRRSRRRAVAARRRRRPGGGPAAHRRAGRRRRRGGHRRPGARVARVGRSRGRRGRPRQTARAAAKVSLPNFAGMTIAEAIRAAHRSGVELAFDETPRRCQRRRDRAAAGAGPGPARHALPRRFRTARMSGAGPFRLRALLEGVPDVDLAGLPAARWTSRWPRCATTRAWCSRAICSWPCPAPRSTGASSCPTSPARGARVLVIEGAAPTPAFPGVVVRVRQRAARAGRDRRQPLRRRRRAGL